MLMTNSHIQGVEWALGKGKRGYIFFLAANLDPWDPPSAPTHPPVPLNPELALCLQSVASWNRSHEQFPLE